MSDFDKLVREINKKFGYNDHDIVKFGNEYDEPTHFSTGILPLDVLLGKGLVTGRIVEFGGSEGSGKSTLAAKVVGSGQDFFRPLGKKVMYIDSEGTSDKRWMALNGVNVEELLLIKSKFLENDFNAAIAACESGLVGLIIIDTTADMVSKYTIENKLDVNKIRMGGNSLALSQAVTMLYYALQEYDVACVLITQLRANLDSMYEKTKFAGGHVVAHAVSARIKLSNINGQNVTEGTEVKAIAVKASVVKNKLGMGGRIKSSAMLYIDLDKGYSEAYTVFELGKEIGALVAGNSFLKDAEGNLITIYGEKIRGKEAIITAMEQNIDFLNQIRTIVQNYIAKADLTDATIKEEGLDEGI